MGKEKTKELVLKLLACMDKNRGLSTQEITSLVNLIAQETKKAEVRGRIDEAKQNIWYIKSMIEAQEKSGLEDMGVVLKPQDIIKGLESHLTKLESELQESEGKNV